MQEKYKLESESTILKLEQQHQKEVAELHNSYSTKINEYQQEIKDYYTLYKRDDKGENIDN